MSSTERDESIQRLVLALGGILLAGAVLRAAWVCDDAYLTLRSLSQLVHGNGLTWNADERVQAFTHPLWAMLVAPFYALTREPYATLVALSFVASCATAWLVTRLAATRASAIVALAFLVSSKAFVDFSTSGLENPLTHALLAWFLVVYFSDGTDPRARLAKLAWIAGLGALNRLDTLVIFAPCLFAACRGLGFRPAAARVARGFAPLALWSLFALVVYGFPFPNTAYAKLGTGLDALDLVRQGAQYLKSTLDLDPITHVAIALGLYLAWRRGTRLDRALALGASLYVVYVVWIGGDFMSGRFLSAPFVCMVVSIARQALPVAHVSLAFSAVVLAIGLCSPRAPLRFDRTAIDRDLLVDRSGIADERAFHAATHGLLASSREEPHPFRFHREGPDGPTEVSVVMDAGLKGYDAPLDQHLVDVYALADPFLARLPMIYTPHWRIGHFERAIPDGYLETCRTGKNVVTDERLARFLDDVRLVTRGPLFSAARWGAILRLNLGSAEARFDPDVCRFPRSTDVPAAQIETPVGEGASHDAPGVRAIPTGTVLAIRFEHAEHAREIVLGVDYNDVYDLVFQRAGSILGRARIEISNIRGREPGIRAGRVDVPSGARSRGFDTLRVVPSVGDSRYAVGGLVLVR